MQEATNGGPADRALVGLHPYDLAAVDAEAHVPAGENHSVLGGRVADHTFLLGLVSDVGRSVVDSINIIEVHNLIIVKQLLLQELEADVFTRLLLEGTISELDILTASSFIFFGVDSLNRDHNRIEIFLVSK